MTTGVLMKKLAAAIVFILLTVRPQPGWTQSAKAIVLDEIAAKVNAEIILKSEVEKAEKDLQRDLSDPARGLSAAQAEKIYNEQKPNVLRNLIDESLLLQIAKEQGLSAELDVAKAMEQLRQERSFPSME